MNVLNDTASKPYLAAMTEAQLQRSAYMAVLLAFLLPPFAGGTLMGFMGFYPLPEFYFIFGNYRVFLYVGAVTLAGLASVPLAIRYIVGLTQLEHLAAQEKAKRFFSRLPWILFGVVTLYSIGGALSADFTLEAMDVRHYTVREHLFNQLGLIPVVLITAYPVFFFFIDRLGRYLGPRGISAVAIPLWMKVLMLGIVTPLLIESTLIGRYLNETGAFEIGLLALWALLASFSVGGTWLAWRSLRQSLIPLEAFITSGSGPLSERARINLIPQSLDELGVLTARFAELIATQQQLSGDLQRSQLLASSVIDNAGALVLVLDREGRIVRFNHACENLSGYTFAEIEGKYPWDTVLPPEEVESVRKNAFEALTHNPQALSGRYTNSWVSKSGGSYLIDWYNTLLLDDDGKVQFLISIGTDVTERRQGEAKLRLSEEKLNEAQRIAQLGNWELDLEGGQLFWSDEIFNLFEIDKKKFGATYEAFLHAIHPDDRDEVNRAYSNSLETKSPYEITHRLLMDDGRIKWVRERGESNFDAQGKPVRSVGTVQDVTEHHNMSLVLEENEILFRTLAQVAPVGIFRTDASGSCTYVNEHYCEIAAMKKEAALGNGWLSVIYPDDRERVFHAWSEAVKNSTIFLLEYRFQRPSGFIIWVVGQARAEIDSQGKVRGYVGTITDINRRKYAETALERLNSVLEERVEQRTVQLEAAREQAEQASRSKSLFLTSMSHELRTPLNAILGYAQLMQIDPELPAHVVENAHEIKRAGDYLLALMNDILDLARIESGRLEMKIEAFAPSEVLNVCRTQNSQVAARRNIALLCEDNCNLIEIKADRLRLLQVLNNLVSNAIKYNRDGGKVTVSCKLTANGRVMISVKDTGKGIAPERQAQLFEPFNRLGAEMSMIEGTGIGLVIARRLIESMQGSIGLESTPGTGSTFWVELPIHEAATAEIAAEPIPDRRMWDRTRPAKKIRILVAEDYVANQVVLRLQLQSLGCEVDIAVDGADALDKWRTARHDLILTDLNMPVMDGIALARAVREDERSSGGHVPIIGITAAAERSELDRCRAAGMDEVLTKPIAIEGLSGVLSRWAGGSMTSKVEAPDTPTSSADAILDMAQLYRILGRVNIEQARDLVEIFLGAAREGLGALESNFSDAQAVSREMHKLKSSARTVGAMLFANLAEALEKRSKEGETDIAAMTELKLALSAVEAAAVSMQLDTNSQPVDLISAIPTVSCRSVLVIDDDLVVLQQMTDMLATLGVAEVLTASSGMAALKVMDARSSELEVLVCDLNMPGMDGVELIRKFGQTGFNGGLILMSGEDEKVLSTVSRLAGLQGLRVLGQVQKPAMPYQIAELLARTVEGPVSKRPAGIAPIVTRDDILAGMAGAEFSVWFQPKVDALSLRPAGFEALARWRRPDGKFIPPDIFITVAEHDGLIGELSKALVITALQEGAKIFAAGFPLKIAINLSGRWLNDLNLPEFIHANTDLVGLRAEDVILEVTETGVMEDLTTALDVLTRLRLKGFGLSIDDFGIGYSSFEQLGRIPFTELKLDRSFVNRAAHDVAANAILESSMDMARKLGLSTVAEGVETEAELELIRSLGCDRAQGYLIAKPMPLDDLLTWLRSQ